MLSAIHLKCTSFDLDLEPTLGPFAFSVACRLSLGSCNNVNICPAKALGQVGCFWGCTVAGPGRVSQGAPGGPFLWLNSWGWHFLLKGSRSRWQLLCDWAQHLNQPCFMLRMLGARASSLAAGVTALGSYWHWPTELWPSRLHAET